MWLLSWKDSFWGTKSHPIVLRTNQAHLIVLGSAGWSEGTEGEVFILSSLEFACKHSTGHEWVQSLFSLRLPCYPGCSPLRAVAKFSAHHRAAGMERSACPSPVVLFRWCLLARTVAVKELGCLAHSNGLRTLSFEEAKEVAVGLGQWKTIHPLLRTAPFLGSFWESPSSLCLHWIWKSCPWLLVLDEQEVS